MSSNNYNVKIVLLNWFIVVFQMFYLISTINRKIGNLLAQFRDLKTKYNGDGYVKYHIGYNVEYIRMT